MTQRCDRPFSEDWLSGYLDGAMSRSDGRIVQRHLRHCAECRCLVDDFREVRELLSGLPQVGMHDLVELALRRDSRLRTDGLSPSLTACHLR